MCPRSRSWWESRPGEPAGCASVAFDFSSARAGLSAPPVGPAIGKASRFSARLTHPADSAKFPSCRWFHNTSRPCSASIGPKHGRFPITAPAMNVPLLDLVAQYRTIKDDVLAAMMSVVERQGFIMGPEVAQLEVEI